MQHRMCGKETVLTLFSDTILSGVWPLVEREFWENPLCAVYLWKNMVTWKSCANGSPHSPTLHIPCLKKHMVLDVEHIHTARVADGASFRSVELNTFYVCPGKIYHFCIQINFCVINEALYLCVELNSWHTAQRILVLRVTRKVGWSTSRSGRFISREAVLVTVTGKVVPVPKQRDMKTCIGRR